MYLLFRQLYVSPKLQTVDMVLWVVTRIVPCDSQLWAIQCTWSSYRNNWMLL